MSVFIIILGPETLDDNLFEAPEEQSRVEKSILQDFESEVYLGQDEPGHDDPHHGEPSAQRPLKQSVHSSGVRRKKNERGKMT